MSEFSEGKQDYPNLLIVVGASAGGLEQLIKLIQKLPDYFQATVMFACHRDPNSPNLLGEILSRNTNLAVREPIEGEKLLCTTLYVGGPKESIGVEGKNCSVDIDTSEVSRMERIDDLFISAARSAGKDCVGVILSGMLRDGVEGLRAIHDAGGHCLVQDPETAAFDSMPRHAIEAVDVAFVGTTEQIADRLIELVEDRVCRL